MDFRTRFQRYICCFGRREQPDAHLPSVIQEPDRARPKDAWLRDGTDIARKDLPVFKLTVTSGRVVEVYDGDTFTIAANPFPDVPGSLTYQFQVRMNGIDAPEMKPKKAGRTEESLKDEKEAAAHTKAELSKLILNRCVTLQISSDDKEKYGRLLADVYIDGIHVNSHLLKERLVVSYAGGTKVPPVSWIKYRISGSMI